MRFLRQGWNWLKFLMRYPCVLWFHMKWPSSNATRYTNNHKKQVNRVLEILIPFHRLKIFHVITHHHHQYVMNDINTANKSFQFSFVSPWAHTYISHNCLYLARLLFLLLLCLVNDMEHNTHIITKYKPAIVIYHHQRIIKCFTEPHTHTHTHANNVNNNSNYNNNNPPLLIHI